MHKHKTKCNTIYIAIAAIYLKVAVRLSSYELIYIL